MRLLRSRLTGKPNSAEAAPYSQKVAENNKNVGKRRPMPSRFIGNSSHISTMLQLLPGEGTSREGAGPLPALLLDQGSPPGQLPTTGQEHAKPKGLLA
jgi:hypothetical protein